MNLGMTVHIWKEDDQYVAHAMPLDVMSSGTTPQEARQALDEAVRVFLLTAADMGTLADFFAASPLHESGLEIERLEDGPRDLAL